MPNDIEAAMAEAEAAEANKQTAAQSMTPASAPAGGPPATTVAAPQPLSMDETMNQVANMFNSWLKVDFTAITIGDVLVQARKKGAKPTKDKCVEMYICAGELRARQTIRYGQNPAQYASTYDRVTCLDGTPWADALARAAQIQPDAKPYPSFEIPMAPVTDFHGDDGGVLVDAVTGRIGFTTTPTGNPPAQQLWKEMKLQAEANGIPLEQAIFKVEIVHEPKNQKGNKWGVIHFENITLIPDGVPT